MSFKSTKILTTDTDLLSINNLPQNFGNEGDFIEFFVQELILLLYCRLQ